MYLALYRKYRPVTFEDVISQEHITTTLENEIMADKTAHAYLFTGPRGTGKTTCSKILAMAVNCENPQNGNPCLVCDSCKSIAQGSTMDVVEIDGASNNRVDDIRDLRDEAVYTPASCKYRVYIIDEVHMLSSGAFNALLKIMEEPPPHVKFIMATTEPHKVPATILSRCQQFDFKRIRSEDIAKRIVAISQKEPFTVESDAAELIARLADGGMRDALSLLDQCAAYADHITLETVSNAAGISGREELFSLVECIIKNDAGKAISIIGDLYERSKDLQRLLSEMIHQMRNIMLVQTVKNPDKIIDAMPDEKERLSCYAKQLSPMQVINIISYMQLCFDNMAKTIDKRTSLELCFVKLCTPTMNSTKDDIEARLETLEAVLKNGVAVKQKPEAVQKPLVKKEAAASPQEIPKEEAPTEQVQTLQKEEIIPEPVPQKSPIPEKEPLKAKPQRAKEPQKVELADLHTPDCWAEVMDELQTTAGHIYAALMGAQVLADENGVLYISSPMPMFAKMLKQDGFAAKLVGIVEQKCGIRYKLRVKSAKAKEATDVKKENVFADILNKARENGVEVTEE